MKLNPEFVQWKRDDKQGEENGKLPIQNVELLSELNVPLAILTSFNRNFKSRNDGNKLTMNFIASPTIVTAMAFSGSLSFNPITDSISLADGTLFRFQPPKGQDLPQAGFTSGNQDFYPVRNPAPQPEVPIVVRPDSHRLELLEPFTSPFGEHNARGLELPTLKVLLRVRGKCTTDHISAAVSALFITSLY